MKALIRDVYGLPDVLQLIEFDKPKPSDDQILIKVKAASVNGSDKENLLGKPLYSRFAGLLKPNNKVLGSDIAGVVEAVGKDHKEFKQGDEVFGELPSYHGGFAEYICTQGKTLAIKPASLTFEQAAAIPQAGVIAYRGIVKQGFVKAGHKVLINGGGGSGGSFAIQLAKLIGAEVTAVDSTEKHDFMRFLGADKVIDYKVYDFTQRDEKYDFILDLIAHKSIFAYFRALKPGGRYFMVGGSIGVILQVLLLGQLLGRQNNKTLGLLAVPQNREDLIEVAELCTAGKLIPAIDKCYPMTRAKEALTYVVESKAKGKIVISME